MSDNTMSKSETPTERAARIDRNFLPEGVKLAQHMPMALEYVQARMEAATLPGYPTKRVLADDGQVTEVVWTSDVADAKLLNAWLEELIKLRVRYGELEKLQGSPRRVHDKLNEYMMMDHKEVKT